MQSETGIIYNAYLRCLKRFDFIFVTKVNITESKAIPADIGNGTEL
jgi:hypothetical protein